jgi:hypothetical protein
MIDLLSRIPKAQKATSYGWKNKCASKGENSAKCAGKSALPPDENNGFTIDREKENRVRSLAENPPPQNVIV